MFALSAPAFAQEGESAPAQAGVSSGEIVVQARRRDESVQDVPSVVNAVTSEAIEQLNLRKVEDIAAIVPGLSLTPNANGIGSVTTIRGVNFDVNQSGNAATVEFYLNDAPTTSNAVLQGMFDIAQIEVLRGPQGTLKGRSSPSGSISIATRRPDLSEAGMTFNGTVNDINGWNMNGAMNVPIIGDKLAVRVAGLVSDDDGTRVHAVNNSRPLRNRTEAGRVSVRADPFDGVLLLDFLYQTLDRTGRSYDAVQSLSEFGPTSDAAPSPITISARDRLGVEGVQRIADQNFKIYNWGAQLSQFGQRLVYVGQVTKQHLNSFDPSNGDAAGIFTNPVAPDGTRLGRATTTNSKNTSHEIRLQNEERVAGMFDYVVGFLRYKTSSNTFPLISVRSSTASPAPAPGVTPILTSIATSTSQRYSSAVEESVFGNVTAHIGENTEISGGIRHIWYETLSGLRALVGGNLIDVPAYRNEASPEATIYSASLKHDFTEDLMAYAGFGTSWRPETVVIGFPPTHRRRSSSNSFQRRQKHRSRSKWGSSPTGSTTRCASTSPAITRSSRTTPIVRRAFLASISSTHRLLPTSCGRTRWSARSRWK